MSLTPAQMNKWTRIITANIIHTFKMLLIQKECLCTEIIELVRSVQPGCICRSSDMSPGPSSGNATGVTAPTHSKSESPWSRVVLWGMFLPKILRNGGGGECWLTWITTVIGSILNL